jgi:ubiquinone/menaquinone biosynthesis C-methylase UbiE
VRRGLERYAPEDGYDPGPLARNKIAQIVVQKAGLFPGDWVLDVETGSGILGVNVARAFTRAKVVATDSDRERLEKARDNARAEGCEARVRFVQCLPDALPFKDEFSFFSTVGLELAREEEPLDVLDEIHRATGFYGKIYAATVDLRKARKKVRGMKTWIFDDETVAQMRAIGYGKVQMQQVAVLPDGGRLLLVTTKRFDAEEGDEEEDDEEDDE